MPSISETIGRLAAFGGTGQRASAPVAHFNDLEGFGDNPGALRAMTFVPANLGRGAPLVVALHGCTQIAADYDQGTGWSVLAERASFALLLPQQVRTNNANLCFNWFSPEDIGRTGGEAESVAQMVRTMIDKYDIDPGRVFVTGLSAGGAMAAVMLATYPDLFAGGAVIGGLPYGCASSVPQALTCMRGRGLDAMSLAAAISRASGDHKGSWPTISIWHGTADATVDAANMYHLGVQWRGVHGVDGPPTHTRQGANWESRVWRCREGRDVVAEWSVAGLGHGVPIDPSGPDGLGAIGPFMLDVGLPSTMMIAGSWGIIPATELPARTTELANASAPTGEGLRAETDATTLPLEPSAVQKVIEDALRSAGLIR